MTKIALLFPGQGAQKVGMGREFYDTSKEAREVFERAEAVIGNGLTDVIFNGPQEKLTSTAYCQPAIMTMSLAALAAFKASPAWKAFTPVFAAGLSLGEYSALVAGGVLTLEEGLKLVQKRAEFMEDATREAKGAMAAIIGFDEGKLLEVCAQTGAEVANFNAPDQIVITGHADKVEAACGEIKALGGKVIPLVVSGAFHSSLMRPAAERFKDVLATASFQDGDIEVISNVDGRPESGKKVEENLAKQITSSVQWVASIEYMVSHGVTEYFEVGPGRVLKGLLKKINPDLNVRNIQAPGDLEV